MFFSGQKVVCIDDEGCPLVRRGAIYTISRVLPATSRRCDTYDIRAEMVALLLEGVKLPAYYDGFWTGRFRPVVDRPTSIAVFKKMLHKKRLKV